jgi:hypothetical protein
VTAGFVWSSVWIKLGVVLVAVLLTGCSASDYAREEALPVPVPANEFRAEAQINDFLSALESDDFDAACRDHLTVRLQLAFAARAGSCEEAFEDASKEGGFNGPITVLGSDKTKNGLWVRTDEGNYLMHGDRIAFFRP